MSYDEVTTAQNSLGENVFFSKACLRFLLLKAAFGTKYDDRSLALGQYDPQPLKQVLIVGDAGADILAAKGHAHGFCRGVDWREWSASPGVF